MQGFLTIRGVRLRGASAVLALATLVVPPAAGQTQTVSACYVPAVGALYLIKFTGLPTACLSTDHVEIGWREGVLADGAVTVAKLAFDPATQAEFDAWITILKAAGTVNESANPVDWTKLKGVLVWAQCDPGDEAIARRMLERVDYAAVARLLTP